MANPSSHRPSPTSSFLSGYREDHAATYTDRLDPGPHRVLILRRVRLAGALCVPGMVVRIDASRLRVAAHLCRTGAARPADAATRLDVELFDLLGAVIPPTTNAP